jgi:hypothetical protein
MTIQITLDAVREAAKAAVAERGEDYDYKAHYDSCRYTQYRGADRVAGCLVGDVMHRLGVPLGTLFTWDDSGSDDLLTHLANPEDGPGGEAWVSYADERAAEYVSEYLRVAQEIQDAGGEGHTWGDALRAAEAEVAAVTA